MQGEKGLSQEEKKTTTTLYNIYVPCHLEIYAILKLKLRIPISKCSIWVPVLELPLDF